MIVVSDTSPLTCLLTIGEEELLLQLFTEVIIPDEVATELRRSHSTLPPWIRQMSASNSEEVRRFAESVDAGEAEAIELAKELGADRLLIDERKGRRLAVAEGIPVIGLLGVVLLAKKTHLISSARGTLLRLEQEAGMYLSEAVREEALKAVGE